MTFSSSHSADKALTAPPETLILDGRYLLHGSHAISRLCDLHRTLRVAVPQVPKRVAKPKLVELSGEEEEEEGGGEEEEEKEGGGEEEEGGNTSPYNM